MQKCLIPIALNSRSSRVRSDIPGSHKHARGSAMYKKASSSMGTSSKDISLHGGVVTEKCLFPRWGRH